MTSRPIITATNLVKRYGEFTAVNKINFEIQEGECFGFLGPNGAGKTSTMKMLYCLSPISMGNLSILGDDVRRFSSRIKRSLGVVPQDNNLDVDLSVLNNLLIYARYFDIPAHEALVRAESLLKFLQLDEKRDEKITTLSGGMKRRLIIARALIHNPKILILDEPTTGLDPQARHLIWKKLRGLKKSGVTMILTTHYMEEASQLCDRLVMMNEGKIVAQGAPQELTSQYVGREVFEVRGKTTDLVSIRDLAQTSGFDIELLEDILYIFIRNNLISDELLELIKKQDFHHRMASLEDVFLKVTGRDLHD